MAAFISVIIQKLWLLDVLLNDYNTGGIHTLRQQLQMYQLQQTFGRLFICLFRAE